MSSLGKIIKDDKHPLWLIDAIILSAAVYSKDPEEELRAMNEAYGLPPSAQYEFVPEEELREAGFENCRQTLVVVRSLTGKHVIAAFRGTFDVSDALTDLKFIHRTLSLGPGAAHAGFLDRAKTIPLDYFRRLLIRGENLVLAGHSLGGAVASLLGLRLLEATGRWCHQQLQCYTFGCPFFADYSLARHINVNYKRHFVHIVSRDDIVPKVMPVAYMIYSMWAGLQAGPLQEVMHLGNLAFMAGQLVMRRKNYKVRIFTVCAQAIAWFPGLLRIVLHRALALALSHQSGYGYYFAGKMVLLDPDKSAVEYVDQDCWTVRHHLNFHLGAINVDVVKGHSLLSYIDNVFAIQSTEIAAASATLQKPNGSKVEVCTASLNMQLYSKSSSSSSSVPVKRKSLCMMDTLEEVSDESSSSSSEQEPQERHYRHYVKTRVGTSQTGPGEGIPRLLQRTKTGQKKQKHAKRAFRSKVACLIFARRIQEASSTAYIRRQERRRPFMRFLVINLGRVSRFAHQFDFLFVCSSLFYVGVQVHKLWRGK
ncbi:hypothetical protein SELMODRAFT_442287 [Selaginella moellendorffii]|uniref:Fungal lipase-type domain-containing protein n=1 Tax=Selaginella moellendorffii TaxID=88036 RepID=D8RSA3_SELML|nr:uncharacterized protein LOC9643075 [Selaginella moellendorffii]EFJ25030.1 hypothetical protein SELMODRAFT_442287 [Selaginella moellendorffii]|eukprot:XP_002974075.1 uncharacterized protein LOC9643075 [Selaginella moellendorffii]